MKLLFKFLTWSAALLLLCLIVLGGQSIYRAEVKRQALSEEVIAEKAETCAKRDTEARAYVTKIQQQGRRVTDPRVFYSPKLNRCLYTYLLINPRLPEATTFNEFLIYDLDKNQPLFFGEGERIIRWDKYLEKVAILEQQ